jgi:hypothetical protein
MRGGKRARQALASILVLIHTTAAIARSIHQLEKDFAERK